MIGELTQQLWKTFPLAAEGGLLKAFLIADHKTQDHFLTALQYLAGRQGHLTDSTIDELLVACHDSTRPISIRHLSIVALAAIPLYNIAQEMSWRIADTIKDVVETETCTHNPYLVETAQRYLAQHERLNAVRSALEQGTIVIDRTFYDPLVSMRREPSVNLTRLGYSIDSLNQLRLALAYSTTDIINRPSEIKPRNNAVERQINGPRGCHAVIRTIWAVESDFFTKLRLTWAPLLFGPRSNGNSSISTAPLFVYRFILTGVEYLYEI